MIHDLKEFEKLLKLCRKQGVTHISLGGVQVTLGDLPEKQRKENELEEAEQQPPELTPEELMNWNAR